MAASTEAASTEAASTEAAATIADLAIPVGFDGQRSTNRKRLVRQNSRRHPKYL
jgi:hypothetical protein